MIVAWIICILILAAGVYMLAYGGGNKGKSENSEFPPSDAMGGGGWS